MDEQTVKHLDLLQTVIMRLAQNSFSLKGWAVTLTAAIFALSARGANPLYFLVALLPTATFWGLDAYYLRQENLFCRLYDAVRTLPPSEMKYNPFSMDTLPYSMDTSRFAVPYSDRVPTWWRTCWSKTVAWLYGPMVVVSVAVTGLAYALR